MDGGERSGEGRGIEVMMAGERRGKRGEGGGGWWLRSIGDVDEKKTRCGETETCKRERNMK